MARYMGFLQGMARGTEEETGQVRSFLESKRDEAAERGAFEGDQVNEESWLDGLVFEQMPGGTGMSVYSELVWLGSDSSIQSVLDEMRGSCRGAKWEISYTCTQGWDGAGVFSGIMRSMEVLTAGDIEDRDSLASFAVPEGVTVIASGAFSGCSRLEAIDLGSSVASIEPYAFENCTSLQQVVFPESLAVSGIGQNAFKGCRLKRVVFLVDDYRSSFKLKKSALGEAPEAIEALGIRPTAFPKGELREAAIRGFEEAMAAGKECSASVRKEYETAIAKERGASTSGAGTAAKAAASGKASQAASNAEAKKPKSSAFEGREVELAPPMSVPAGKYFGASALERIIVGAGRKRADEVKVGKRAFAECPKLRDIQLVNPAKCTLLFAEAAFEGCPSIEEISIGSYVEIGKGAFEACGALKSVRLDWSAHVGQRAFAECESLECVVFDGGVYLDLDVFEGCDNLESVVFAGGISTKSPLAWACFPQDCVIEFGESQAYGDFRCEGQPPDSYIAFQMMRDIESAGVDVQQPDALTAALAMEVLRRCANWDKLTYPDLQRENLKRDYVKSMVAMTAKAMNVKAPKIADVFSAFEGFVEHGMKEVVVIPDLVSKEVAAHFEESDLLELLSRYSGIAG